MFHLNKKGFLLLDSLVIVIIVSFLSIVCISVFTLKDKYSENLKEYYSQDFEQFSKYYSNIDKCEACKLDQD